MRPSGTHLYKMVCPSVGPSVRPSVRLSVTTPVQKPRFSAVFGHGDILHWNKWSTKMFWEPPLLLSHFTRLFVFLSLHMCHMINTRWDTARTHRCPVGLVFMFSVNYRIWRSIIFQSVKDFFAALVMPEGSHVMSLDPVDPMYSQIWRQLQRKKHTSLKTKICSIVVPFHPIHSNF